MQLSNLLKTILIIAISSSFLAGCGTSSSGGSTSAPSAETPKTEPPFARVEPETYQTEIVVTTAGVVERFLAVRDGKKWRIDTGYGGARPVTSLGTDKSYVLSNASKIFSDYDPGHGFDDRSGMIEEITRGMLNKAERAVYEKLGSEVGVTKYKMWGEAGKNLETIFSFDEKSGLPVKMEVFKNGQGAGPVDVTVELKDFKSDVDQTLFVIPKDFKKVPLEEMKKVLIAAP